MSQRQERFARLIQAEVASLLREVKDPRVTSAGLVTITSVRVTADLGLARVGVTLHGGDPAKEKALVEGLTRSAGFMRAQLRGRIDAKKTPELRFEIDQAAEHSAKVNEILERLKNDE